MFHSERLNRLSNRILQGIVLVYQGLALVIFVVIPFLADNWLRTPFIGAFVEQTLVFNGVGAGRDDPAWDLFQKVELGDQLVQVDGTNIRSTSNLVAVLRQHAVGDSFPVTVQAPDGLQRSISITLHSFPATDRLLYLFIPYAVGLIFLAISLWIFGLRRNESAGRSFAMFASSVAIASAALFDLYTSHVFSLLWTFSLAMAAGGLIDLSMTFPQEMRGVANRPYLRWFGYLAGIVLTVLAGLNLYNFADPTAYIASWQLLYGLAGVSVLVFLGIMIYRRLTSKSPIVRQQANTILWGILFAFGPLGIFFLLASFISFNFPPLLLALTIIFPAVTGYSVLRQRLLRTDFLIRQGVLYALLSILVLGGYALLVSGLFLIFGPAFQSNNPIFIGALVFLLALVLNPIRTRLQMLIDRVFFRGERAYEQRVRDFSHALTSTVDLSAIVRTLRQHVTESLLPENLYIYVYDPLNDLYAASAGEDGRPTSDIRFTINNALPQVLGRNRLPIVYDPGTISAELKPDQARLDILGAMLFVPMPGSEHLIGWLALGPRRSGETYQSADLTFLDQVGTAAAVAIERAQVIFNLEHRVREMNILARIAQGVNVTVGFDDILELIYAQTDQVLPVDEFHITLYNRESEYFYFAFCLENDDRVVSRENLPLEPNMGLSQEVIRSRRPLLTSDYGQECQAHGLTVHAPGIHAWVGVPLNTGKETIGALSVGSRDSNVTYTTGQMEILQSIANQAAGAIVKTRLLQETEQRARQLTILNEITRQLTGTLDSEPLLEKILQSAVGILNCEAGTLFLVDDHTDELVFRVVISPVAVDLVGQRLAPGTGIVGEAVNTQRPVIANNVQKTNTWYASTDKTTGFETRAILAVPMQVKEHVIGVLEVINRQDGLPFVEDDVNLLAAFAGQAAVAIENSRLYTLTDQELNDRVEELSVMQRIDRELNASLEVGRAMRITLEWALRQSKSDAGLIGVLEGNGMRLTAQQGYDEIEETYKDSPIPLEQPALRAAIDSGQPQRISLDDSHPGLLPGALTQTVIPIRREAAVIGLVVLECKMDESQVGQDLVFLSRLSDHAAIAIANAQLYNEVQRANDAKSEFVSLVAHELKNPMTSIKGYSELLAKGAVGPVTEMQGNFLNTIQSNVERMSTLVSDLNDNSKIEAGRLRLDFKAIELAGAVEEVMRSTKRQLDDKKQSATADISAKLAKVWADPTRLAQILVNLISNANKYTPEGGQITVGAEQSTNQWDPDGAAEVMHIWVKDNGIGINLDDQQKIFQKFFRSDDQKARESPGTGLGLNITRSLVEMMGGRIWFESEFRQGTTFHFTVPVAEA
jgi:signal transduction histidine kinase/putative methionine-R-sulfoxide reductase with GAF domain